MRRLLSHWPLFAVAVVLLWPFPYVAPLRPPNELSRLYQARAIVEDGTLAIDGMMRRHGGVGDLSRFAGRHYPNKAPGLSLLGAGVFGAYVAVSGREAGDVPLHTSLWLLEKVLLALPTLLLLFLLRAHVRRRHADNRFAVDAAVLAWALGSAALPYGLLLYSHQLAAVLLFGGFLAYQRAAEGREGYVALGALLGGLAIAVEYTVAPAVGITALYALFAGNRGRAGERAGTVARRAAYGLAGAAVPIAVLLWYHWRAFGGPLETGYAHLASAGLAALHHKGVLGVSGPRLEWFARSLFDPRQGLLIFSPWLLLAFPGIALVWRRPGRRAEALAAAAVTLFYLLFTASWDAGIWGWVVGPRHLAPMLPFLVGPTAATLSWLRDRPGLTGPRLAGAATGLVFTAAFSHVVAVVTYPHLPPDLDNGIWQLAVPLLLDGYVVHNLGSFLAGEARWWHQLPVLIAAGASLLAVGALYPGRASPRGRVQALGLALAVASVLLGAWAIYGRPGSELRHTRDFVTRGYDPQPGAAVAPLFPGD